MIPALAALAASLLPAAARAHGFDERYDLPAPLAYFVAGAAAAVALSFVVAALFARCAPPASRSESGPHGASVASVASVGMGRLLPALRLACQVVSVAMACLTISAALWGTGDPMMNFAPTFVWIIWWVGLSLAAALVGNLWPALDPWRALFEWIDAAARRLGIRRGIVLGWSWPRALGAWPAVLLLLAWSGFEVVYPLAAVPTRLGTAALVWSLVTLAGMVCFGREAWQRHADVFAIYFATLGRLAPLALGHGARGARGARGNSIIVRAPGEALITSDAGSAAMIAFIVAMLSTVLFDGLHGGQAWLLFEQLLKSSAPQLLDANGYFAGTAGLVGVWLVFFAAYECTCIVTAWLVRDSSAALIARRFAPTLVPIAVAYNIAHNFSSLLIQGQNAIPLLSDPLGRRWNLFGTAGMVPNIGIVDARLTWYVAVGAIVAGHVIAVWLAHRIALREYGAPRKAVVASVPLTALMVAYTVISLSVIAEPMVTFELPPSVEVPAGPREAR